MGGLPSFLSDIRYAARSWLRSPALTASLLVTIGIGLGSNLTVRGFIQGLSAVRIPIASREGVVSILARDRVSGAVGPLTPEEYTALRGKAGGFEWIGAVRIAQKLVRLDQDQLILSVAEVTPEIARLFGLALEDGAVFGRHAWQDAYRGKKLRLDGREIAIAGKAPDGLEGVYRDRAVDLWIPMAQSAQPGGAVGGRSLWVLAAAGGRGTAAFRGDGFLALPYTGMTPETMQSLARLTALLGVAAGFVLLIACVNVASFLLGRASLRAPEMSIRVALGVSRARMAQAIVCDALVIALAGGALSIVLAQWTSQVIPALLFDQDAELLVQATDWRRIAAAAAAGIALVTACGMLPLFAIRHDRPAEVLGRDRGAPPRAMRMLRAGLVVAQMASCCALVIGTGLLYSGFQGAMRTSTSERLGHAVLATVQVHRDLAVDQRFFQRVEQAAKSVAGVTAKGWAARLPGSQPEWRSFRVEPARQTNRIVMLQSLALSPGMQDRFVLPLKSGRMFRFEDQSCRSAVVNEAAARALFPDAAAGRSIRDASGEALQILGVAVERKPSRGTALYFDATDPFTSRKERLGMQAYAAPVPAELPAAELDANVVSPGYFEAMGFRLTTGEVFPGHPKAHGCRVAMVNEEAAELYFGGEAVGAAVIDEAGQRTEIVGVVHTPRLGLFERRTEPAIYFPMAQDCQPTMTLVLAASKPQEPMLGELRMRLTEVPGRGPSAPKVRTLETYLGQTALAPLRIAAAILAACAVTGLLLGVLGLYGALSDAARVRRRETAIRVALGAGRRHVAAQVLGEGMRLAAAGAALGLLAAGVASRMMPLAAADGIEEWAIWMAGPVMLAAAAAVASLAPMKRALLVHPVETLREA